MSTVDHFPNLVTNAFDFLEKSIDSFDLDIKASVIGFYTAVELFLKARLLREHWSLVVAKSKEPDLDEFSRGNFSSVSLEDSLSRLEKVVRSPVPEEAKKAFKALGVHRNKMVHFFHEAAANGKKSNQVKAGQHQAVAKEQLRGWFFLKYLLSEQWKDTFKSYSGDIENVDVKFRKYRDFLRIVFTNLTSDISEKKAKGSAILECGSCGFEAVPHGNKVGIPSESQCLVCAVVSLTMCIDCPECGEVLYSVDALAFECKSCGAVDEEDVVEAIENIEDEYGDRETDVGRANCSDCDGHQTVLRITDNRFFCIDCKALFNGVAVCEWCNEKNTGDMEESFLMGCNMCDGRLGWETDD